MARHCVCRWLCFIKWWVKSGCYYIWNNKQDNRNRTRINECPQQSKFWFVSESCTKPSHYISRFFIGFVKDIWWKLIFRAALKHHFITASPSWNLKQSPRQRPRKTNYTERAEFVINHNESLWVTQPRNRRVMSNPVFMKFETLIQQRLRLTFLSHCIGHCRSCGRVPVGLLVVGSITGQWGPCQSRVLNPFCNSKRHMFSRSGLNRCTAALFKEEKGAESSGTA